MDIAEYFLGTRSLKAYKTKTNLSNQELFQKKAELLLGKLSLTALSLTGLLAIVSNICYKSRNPESIKAYVIGASAILISESYRSWFNRYIKKDLESLAAKTLIEQAPVEQKALKTH